MSTIPEQVRPRDRVADGAGARGLAWPAEHDRLAEIVEREECLTDRRGASIVLIPAGRCAKELAAPVHVAAVRQVVFDDLTDDQVATPRDSTRTVLARPEAAASDATPADQTDTTTSPTPEDP